jgi:hypothetical protein
LENAARHVIELEVGLAPDRCSDGPLEQHGHELLERRIAIEANADWREAEPVVISRKPLQARRNGPVENRDARAHRQHGRVYFEGRKRSDDVVAVLLEADVERGYSSTRSTDELIGQGRSSSNTFDIGGRVAASLAFLDVAPALALYEQDEIGIQPVCDDVGSDDTRGRLVDCTSSSRAWRRKP